MSRPIATTVINIARYKLNLITYLSTYLLNQIGQQIWTDNLYSHFRQCNKLYFHSKDLNKRHPIGVDILLQ